MGTVTVGSPPLVQVLTRVMCRLLFICITGTSPTDIFPDSPWCARAAVLLPPHGDAGQRCWGAQWETGHLADAWGE